MTARWKNLFAGALAAGGILTPGLSRAEDLQERLDKLEQRTSVLERKQENDAETAATKAKDAASATANGSDWFTLRNADKSFALRISGYIQADGRWYLDDDAKAAANTFLIRRARLDLRGTAYKFVDFRLHTSNDNNAAGLQDAYVNLRFRPGFQVLAGQTKVPFGLERLQSNSQALLVEQAYTTSLTPNYEVGLHVFGSPLDGAVTWTIASLNGGTDGANTTGDTNDAKGWVARVFLLPFKSGGSLTWKDLGFGLAATRDELTGASTTTATGLPSFRTPGQGMQFFSYSNTIVNGDRVRWSPQAYWYPGRFGVLAEYVASRADVVRVAAPLTQAKLTNRAWQVSASYSLTGETASYKSIKPLKPFEVGQGGWGAFELAARYTELRIDPATFQDGGTAGTAAGLYANGATQSQRARTWTAGVNWYLNAAAKVQLEYDQTRFTGGGSAGFSRPIVRELLTRFQVAF